MKPKTKAQLRQISLSEREAKQVAKQAASRLKSRSLSIKKKPLKRSTPSTSQKTKPGAAKLGVAKLKKKADALFSIYVRLRDSDARGLVSCISCGAVKPWKAMQNGHFVSRSASVLRYDEENCNAQCVGCNMFKQGNQYAYALAIDIKYGEGTAKKLYAQRLDTHKWTIEELQQIIHDAQVQTEYYLGLLT